MDFKMIPAIPNLLSIITFAPLFGAAVIGVLRLMARKDDEAIIAKNAKWISLWTTLITLALSVVMIAGFNHSNPGYQFEEHYKWFGPLSYHMGVDGISILFVLLTAFLMPLCILASWDSIKDRVTEYMICFLMLETLVIGVFTSLDLFLFYIFFEGGLVPMFLIIGIWGGKDRIYASYKFFLYTLLGSVLMLAAMLYMVNIAGTADIPLLTKFAFAREVQPFLWFAFFASFAVKMPMWPVHTWLPDAHVQAPTAGSVMLAGILLKLGGYGFIRFNLPMFPYASEMFAPLVMGLSVIAIVVTSLIAFRQTDIKKLIAYSSVAHMGFVTMGIFAGNVIGVQGAVFQMISHGVISGALFLCVGVVYDRWHTREIAFYGGLTKLMPHYAFVFLLFTMANVGLPGTSGFIGEITTLVGSYKWGTWVAFVATSGVIFSAVYALTLFKRVMFGEVTNQDLKKYPDLSVREIIIFVPLIVGTIVLGIYPAFVFDITTASVDTVVATYQAVIGG
ncbi:NADH:ubiquinone oxidoreductase subunit M [Asticcacaulis benevestitus DSM 16100 = ATCC BAA-896]|uniref:NADH:ubiquinone oxidoreductase subunit M n=2 Tax=Asticcacaulis TaxID=76890 RepID=V4Q3K9_9CAUL|nr:NADH:ubiquinone oxidoreductase subunit M [Asticcacaulis benevestitus DSM 16100 = ATCC BAA-896]